LRKELKHHLIELVLVSIVPLFLSSAGIIGYFYYQQFQRMDAGLLVEARTITNVVDQRVTSLLTMLQVLTETEAFDAKNFEAIHSDYQRISKEQASWGAIVLTTPNGHVLFSTLLPYGQQGPSVEAEYLKEIVRTKRPAISGFRIGKVSKFKIISLGVPILREGEVKYVLNASLKLENLEHLLKTQKSVDNRVFSIIDASENVLASTYETTVSFEGLTGIFESGKGPHKYHGAFVKSPFTGWVVTAAIEQQEYYRPVVNLGVGLVIGGILVLILGISLALRVGRRISHPMRELSRTAKNLGRGIRPVHQDYEIIELQDISSALEQAADEQERNESTVQALFNVSGVLSHELEQERLFEHLIEHGKLLTGAEVAMIVDAKNDAIPPILENLPVIYLNPEKPVLLEDASKTFKIDTYKSFLIIPLLGRTLKSQGALYFFHSEPGMFTQKHLALLGSIVTQISVAIDNAELYRTAQEAVHLRDSFLSVASHELKTPLTSLFLQYQILRSSIDLTEPAMIDLFDRIQNQLQRFSRLINELLDVSRITAKRLSMHREECHLSRIIEDVAGQFETERKQTGSTFELILAPTAIGQWDRSFLEQIMTNLVSNALKYENRLRLF
jgi:GAF domain-containing protein